MKRILFVEDDTILARVYRRALEAAGFEVQHAPDGESGLALLQVVRPDVILLDLMLPRVSGTELLRIIRGSQDVRTTPVVVFTSAYRESLRQELEELGANRVLSKAEFVPRQVIAVLHELVSGRIGDVPFVQADTREAVRLRQHLPSLLGECGRLAVELNREMPFPPGGTNARQLREAVRQLAGAALSLGLGPQAYFCEALNALLFEAGERPGQLGLSGLRTVTQSVDFLSEAFDHRRRFELSDCTGFDILAVDDDSISRSGIQLALGKIKQKAVEMAQPREALELCQRRSFDLVFLDVQMPELNGYDLCSQIRRTGLNRDVPVVFVTRHVDLHNRAQATMSGGTDFIGKPFNFMELAVKSLIHLLRRKLVSKDALAG